MRIRNFLKWKSYGIFYLYIKFQILINKLSFKIEIETVKHFSNVQ